MHAITDSLTSGFGAMLVAEHDLRDQLRALIAAGHGDQAGSVARVLPNHVLQLDAIIALLERRDRLLPHPVRFDALDACATAQMNPLRKLPQNLDAPFAHLVTINQTLRRELEVLIEQSGHLDADETSLREAARRHGEMESMLTALIKENASPGNVPKVEAAKVEGVWENEGGHGAPPPASGGSIEKGAPVPT
jgi:hypothetical protein